MSAAVCHRRLCVDCGCVSLPGDTLLPLSFETLTQRIRAGKELLEAKRKEEDGAMRRLVEERKREKEEEARAR